MIRSLTKISRNFPLLPGIFLLLILFSGKLFGGSQTRLNTFSSYTPASQNGTCASIVGIGAIWNNGTVNCVGPGTCAGTAIFDVVWYYNTTNSTNTGTATYVYTNTAVSATGSTGTTTITLPAANIIFPSLGGTYYYFCVANAQSCWCAVGSNPTTTSAITLQSTSLPACPTNLTPVTNTVMSCGAAPILFWDNCCGQSATYRVYLDQNPSPTTLVATVSSPIYYSPNLLSNTVYYWKIISVNANGTSSSCTINKITTNTAVLSPTSSDVNFCAPNSVTFNASGGSYPNYFWYDANGNLVGQNSAYTTPVLSGTTTYSVTCGSISGETSQVSNGTPSVGCSNAGAELFFDIQNNTSDYIIVTKVQAYCSTAGTRTIQMRYRTNSYVGNDATTAGWTSVYNNTQAVTAGYNTFVLPTSFTIPPGGKYGMVIWTSDVWLFINNGGTTVGTDMNIIQGSYLCAQTTGPLQAASVAGAQFAGSIFYKLSCQSPATIVNAINNCPLPVELLNFTGNYDSGNDLVSLNWSTATETNNSHFIVERTTDGINYFKIGEVPSQAIDGNSTTPIYYHLNDDIPPSGVIYYRLKQVDINGTQKVAQIISVDVVRPEISMLSIKPNPADETIQVGFSSFDAVSVTIQIFDYTGREVKKNSVDSKLGVNAFDISISDLSPGFYFVQVRSGDNVLNGKLLRK